MSLDKARRAVPGSAGSGRPRGPADPRLAWAVPVNKAAARDFRAFIERPVRPGRERNAEIVDRYNRGNATELDVQRVTTSCIQRLGDRWNEALACLHAIGRCVHPETARRVRPNAILYGAVITACGRAGRTDKALALFDHLQAHGPVFEAFPDATTYGALISACGNAGAVREALSIFDRMRSHGAAFGVFPDTAIWTQMILACKTVASADPTFAGVALALFQDLLDCGPAHGLCPNVATYLAAIATCKNAAAADPMLADRALALFDHLLTDGPAHGAFPNVIVYSALISVCEKAGRFDDAMAVFQHLLSEGPRWQVFPNTITYNAAISACAKAADAERAMSIFRHLRDHGPARGVFPDAITYATGISACVNADWMDRCADLLREGIHGVSGRPDTRVFRPTLGFDPESNELDFHEREVQFHQSNPRVRNPGVHSDVARAIFHVLLHSPEKVFGEGAKGIDERTLFIVGRRGAGTVADAVAACMGRPKDQGGPGWTVVHPPGLKARWNLGALVAGEAPAPP